MVTAKTTENDNSLIYYSITIVIEIKTPSVTTANTDTVKSLFNGALICSVITNISDVCKV
jgi:hypothetical protein